MQLNIITSLKGWGRVMVEGQVQRKYYHSRNSCSYPRGGGHESVKALQKELLRRFPDGEFRRSRKIAKGLIRIEGPWYDRRTQVITLEAE